MTADTLRDIRQLAGQLRKIMTEVTGFPNFESATGFLKVKTTEMPGWPVLAHQMAEQMHPATRGNTVQPEKFGQILTEIDSEEKINGILVQFSEEEGQQLRDFLSDVLFEILPNVREGLLPAIKKLPHRRAGGRKKEVDNERAYRIRINIAKLYESGVNIGDAQRRVAKQENLSERTVREVWQSRKKNQTSAEKT